MVDLLLAEDIQAAKRRIESVVYHTPLIPFYNNNREIAAWFKCENLQPIGSFKIRGSYNRMAALSETEKALGVISYSSGNHAQGVAYAGYKLGIKTLIVMPLNAPSVKIAATRKLGAEVYLYDPTKESREEVTAKLMKDKEWILVPPFDDPYIIAGQSTVGLEIYEDMPDVDLVITPVGGGGLLSGVATILKSLKKEVKIVGVEPELAADAYESFKSGKLVEWSTSLTGRTIADGVRTASVGELTFAHIQKYVDSIVTVTEDEIYKCTRKIILESKLLIEPTAALPLAAYLYHRDELPSAKKLVMVLTGGNIEPSLLKEIIS
jgi:threo-3-hydroxy-L-aspartate ammonia-lyase